MVVIENAPLRGVPLVHECPDESRTRGGDAERRHAILVVDDDAANLKLARFVLEAEGFDVKEAVDAFSTFEVLKTCNPSLIVMDIQLPGIDGWELTRRLKTNFVTRHIPVIAVTAYGVAGDRQLAAAVGAVDFVEKTNQHDGTAGDCPTPFARSRLVTSH